ncbi:hypothetical protein RhiirA1_543884 [Rhizophagus irregularis]|uniref:Uncharacterized protein n=1 Tax=Rhizophagus irregularis TaxID=588596 RepID=A0A2N0QH53_9GLOM|nr:hypothetical protein RhiirA1_543884 [Rhizophagus irregularis]
MDKPRGWLAILLVLPHNIQLIWLLDQVMVYLWVVYHQWQAPGSKLTTLFIGGISKGWRF